LTALPQIAANTIKALAFMAPSRTPVLPDLPTATEQGLPDFAVSGWGAFFFPKGTPAAVIRRLSNAGEALDTSPCERIEGFGYTIPPPEQRSPEYMTAFLPAEIKKWAAPIRAAGITAD
jgi:tripartite-type tricarboxylate transporter receptor subunit TctC